MPWGADTTTSTCFDGVANGQGGTDEIGVAGRVEQVDVLALVVEMEDAGVDGEVAFFLLVVEVGDAGALLDAAVTLDGLGGEQQGIGQRSLAGRAVSHQGHRADVVYAVLGHCIVPFVHVTDRAAARG